MKMQMLEMKSSTSTKKTSKWKYAVGVDTTEKTYFFVTTVQGHSVSAALLLPMEDVNKVQML